MVSHVKMTLNIDDSVTQRLREEASQRGTTKSAPVEAGLHRLLAASAVERKEPDTLPALPTWSGGAFLVDIADCDALYRALEEDE